MNKKILYSLALIGLTFTAIGCGNKGWDKEEDMGEIVIDESDTESLAPQLTEEEVKKVEPKKIEGKLLINKDENCSVITDGCTYLPNQNKVVFKGRITTSEEFNGKIKINVKNYKEEVLATGEMDFHGNPNGNAGFSIDATLSNGTFEDINTVEITIE